MNKRIETEKEIISQAITRLKELAFLADIGFVESTDNSYDFDVVINGYKFICEVKPNVGKVNLGMVLHQLQQIKQKHDAPILLVSKYISPNLVQELYLNNINTLDISGNASIIYDLLRVVVKGEKIIQQSAGLSKPSRLFKEAGIKLLFGFLTNPEIINCTYREMQDVVDLSLGAIKNVMEEMSNNGYLIINGKKRVLKKRTELIERWVISYNETLKPKLFLKSMSFKDNTSWKNTKLPEGTYWGGEPASNLFDGFLIPEDFTIYTKEKIGQLVRLGLRPDENGKVFVYNKFWKSKNTDNTTPKLLVYADLIGSGNGRNIEAAQKIIENGL